MRSQGAKPKTSFQSSYNSKKMTKIRQKWDECFYLLRGSAREGKSVRNAFDSIEGHISHQQKIFTTWCCAAKGENWVR